MSQHSSNPTVACLSVLSVVFPIFIFFFLPWNGLSARIQELICYMSSLSFAPALFYLLLHLCDESKLAKQFSPYS